MNDNFIDKTVKKSPHLLYAVMLLFVGLAFVASWTYIKHQEIEIKRQKQEQEIELKKQQQQSLDEAAAKKEIEEQNRDTLRFECVAAAERDYYKYLALNGKKMKNTNKYLVAHFMGLDFCNFTECRISFFSGFYIIKRIK